MSYYCVKCGKEIRETSPGNGLYCRDCQAAGKHEITLLTNDPRTVSAYRDAAGKAVFRNGKFIFTPSTEQTAGKSAFKNGKFIFTPSTEQTAGKSGSENEEYIFTVPRDRQIGPVPGNNTRSGGYDQQVGHRPGDQAHYSRTSPPPKNNSRRYAISTVCLLAAIAGVVATVFFVLRNATSDTGVREINLRDKLVSLAATDAALGLRDKYSSFDDITGGFIDTDLVGTWNTNYGLTWTYNEDGTITDAEGGSDHYRGQTISTGDYTIQIYYQRFICMSVDAYNVICEEAKMTIKDAESKVTESTALSYSTYEVNNDALFLTYTYDTFDDTINELLYDTIETDYNSAYFYLLVMYRVDENGSTEAAVAKNSISPDTFAGTWVSENGEFTVADGKLSLGEDTFDISVDGRGDVFVNLTVTSDYSTTEYTVFFSVSVQYDDENRTDEIIDLSMQLSYWSEDENDKPNLLPVLDESFSGNFHLQQ